MPVNTCHKEYDDQVEDWQKCRDAYDGQRAVKAAGVKYLPALTGQTDNEYVAYKGRALFYSITSKSVSAMLGMAMSKAPQLSYPDEMTDYFTDNSGTQFYEALGSSISEILLMGRYGMLVDRPADGGRPNIHGYRAESIINWKTDRDGKPSLVVLVENVYDESANDEFTNISRKQYRVLRLIDKGRVLANDNMTKSLVVDMVGLPIVNQGNTDLIYTVSIYDHKEEHVNTIVPTNNGRPMNVIPFYVANPLGLGFGMAKPPMLDIADINISHYRTSADLEHGRHFTGLPTPVVSGVEASTVLKIGSMTAWVLPDAQAKASYLEFTGQGLTSLENAMKEKQTQMASLSSRVMDNSGNGSEAVDAVRLRYMSESASLSSIVRSVEAMLNMCYKTIAAMENWDTNKLVLKLEKEFHNPRMSSTEIAKLTESYLSGGMSVETYVFNLRRGDALSVTRSDEEEIADLVKLKEAMDAKIEAAGKAKEVAVPAPTPKPITQPAQE